MSALWPTGPHAFASEHTNFLCTSNSPLVPVQLPCASPWDAWRSPLRDEFLISAWWPPMVEAIHQYAAAHFNFLSGSQTAMGCQFNGTLRQGASYSEAFDCAASFLPLFDKLGLRVAFDPGFFNSSQRLEDLVYGGAANMGGTYDRGWLHNDPPHGGRPCAFTVPEMPWVKERLQNRSVAHLVHALFLHDDVVTNNRMTADTVAWLRRHWPQVLPLTNTGVAGADTLHEQRQPYMSPEEYMISGATTNATADANTQLGLYAGHAVLASNMHPPCMYAHVHPHVYGMYTQVRPAARRGGHRLLRPSLGRTPV